MSALILTFGDCRVLPRDRNLSLSEERRSSDSRRRTVVRSRVALGGARRAAEGRVSRASTGISSATTARARAGGRCKIDFCEADVLDVFDEWRRATGVPAMAHESTAPTGDQAAPRGPSLPVHMERVLRRLTAAQSAGSLDGGFDDLMDRVAQEMDVARGARGANRQAVIERLAALKSKLIPGVPTDGSARRWRRGAAAFRMV